jgi:hypothetical protein
MVIMKRLLFVISVLAIGLISCTSCTKKNVTPAPTSTVVVPTPVPTVTAPPVSKDEVLSGEGYQLTVPAGWEKYIADPATPGIELTYINDQKHNLVVLLKEPFAGSSNEYVIEAIRGLKTTGAHLTSSTQVVLNGNKFVLIDATNEGARMWLWVTTHNGFGFALSCGGEETNPDNEKICTDIAATFVLN